MEDLELLNVLAQIRHVFGGESFIWRGERCARSVAGIDNMKLTVENGYDLFSFHGMAVEVV